MKINQIEVNENEITFKVDKELASVIADGLYGIVKNLDVFSMLVPEAVECSNAIFGCLEEIDKAFPKAEKVTTNYSVVLGKLLKMSEAIMAKAKGSFTDLLKQKPAKENLN